MPQTTTPLDLHAGRVQRALDEGMCRGNLAIRLVTFAIWGVLWFLYAGAAPWWMIGVPALAHARYTAGPDRDRRGSAAPRRADGENRP